MAEILRATLGAFALLCLALTQVTGQPEVGRVEALEADLKKQLNELPPVPPQGEGVGENDKTLGRAPPLKQELAQQMERKSRTGKVDEQQQQRQLEPPGEERSPEQRLEKTQLVQQQAKPEQPAEEQHKERKEKNPPEQQLGQEEQETARNKQEHSRDSQQPTDAPHKIKRVPFPVLPARVVGSASLTNFTVARDIAEQLHLATLEMAVLPRNKAMIEHYLRRSEEVIAFIETHCRRHEILPPAAPPS